MSQISQMSIEELTIAYEKQSVELNTLRSEVKELKTMVENLSKIQNSDNVKKSLPGNNELSIVFKKYKKSILVKNMYTDKNTTLKCKKELKELEAKWFKTEKEMGWLLVGKFEDGKSLEENSNFIVQFLKDKGFEVEVIYEEEQND